MRARVTTIAANERRPARVGAVALLALSACTFDPRALSPESTDAGATPVDTGVFRVDAGIIRDAEPLDALAEGCGDGRLTDLEACDDGDTESGDGCSADCAIEPGAACTGEPSVCTNPAPIARDDLVRAREDVALELDPTVNDSDAFGDVVTLVATTTPAVGRITARAGNRLTYLPAADAFGRDVFRYTVRDLAGQTATATVTVIVDPVNDAPRARAIGARTAFETPVDLRFDASEPDGHAIRYTVTPPRHGTLGAIDQASATVRYTPHRGYAGVDRFTYVASDAAGLMSPATTATVVVLPADWRVPDAEFRRALCVDGSTVTESLSRFPVLLRAPPRTLSGSGSELVFVDGAGDRCVHDVERWAPDGTSLVWIRVPLVATGTTTCLAVYYGRATPGPGPDAREVWSGGYTSVVHLSGAAQDVRRGEPIGLTGTSTIEGVAGVARAFDGSGFVDLAPGLISARRGTWSGWLRADPALDLSDDVLIAYGTGAASGPRQGLARDEWHLGLDAEERLRVFAWSSSVAVDLVARERVTTGGWHHVAVTWDDDAVIVYVDGHERARATKTSDVFDSCVLTRLGAPFDSAVRRFVGALDEVRIASVTRSAAWIRAERASVAAPGFLVLGPADDGTR